MLATLPMPARRGRPPASDDRAERLKHIRCAGLLLGKAFSARELARLHRVSVKTIYNWRDLALGYDDPEAEGLRRFVRRRRR